MINVRVLLVQFGGDALSQAELLLIYVILSLGSAMVGHDLMQVLVSAISYPHRFATPDNRWEALFFDSLPTRLMVTEYLKFLFTKLRITLDLDAGTTAS